MLIEDKLNGRYKNFLTYCQDAGKKFVHELRDEDFIAYRAEYSVSREEVDELKNFLSLKDSSTKTLIFKISSDDVLKKFTASANFSDTHIHAIIVALENFSASVKNKYFILEKIVPKLREISAQIGNKNIRPFIEAYKFNHNQYLKIPEIELTIIDFAEYLTKNFDEFDAKILIDFIDWLNFDLNSFVENLFAVTARNEIQFTVILGRANDKTLAEIGKKFGLTRERVRQIEKKVTTKILNSCYKDVHNILFYLYALSGGNKILTFDDAKNFISENYAKIIWYILPKINLDKEILFYNAKFKEIIFHGGIVTQNIDLTEFENYLPAGIVEEEIFFDAVKNFAREKNYPVELLKEKLKNIFRHTGKFFHKTGITGVFKCGYILKSCFQNGYKIDDETDFNRFLRYLKEFFGEKENFTQRNIDAKISTVGVLCGRGKYIHPDFVQVPREILDIIENFIEDSERNALPFKEIFKALEKNFVGTQITNHYILQGVIKFYNLPYTTRKDYLVKSDGANIAEEFNAFVEERGEVTSQEIKQEFISFSDHNIAFILPRCPEVIQFGNGLFVHSSQLDLKDRDFTELEKFLKQSCRNAPVTARKILNSLPEKFFDFLTRNKIDDHEKLFGVLRYMFGDKFKFSRPYISAEEIKNVTNQKILLNYLEGTDSVDISDLENICEESGVHFQSNSVTIESLRAKFLRVDEFTLRRAENIGITDEIISAVCDEIKKSLAQNGGWLAAKNFDAYEWLPQLEISWTDFLLESIVALANEKFHVLKIQTTRTDFSNAVFVDETFAEDNFKSFLIKILRKENELQPFQTQEEILNWLQDNGLCNKNLPKVLFDKGYIDADGKISLQ